MSPEQTVREFLEKLFDPSATVDDLRPYLDADATFVEQPNAMSPKGQTRDLETALAGSRLGHQLMASQSYVVRTAAETDNGIVAVQAEWGGTTAQDLGPIAKGTEMRAHIASFWELRDGKIVRVETYDCYEPLA